MRVVIALLVAGMLALGAGCGGSDGHGRLSKSEYEAKLRSTFSITLPTGIRIESDLAAAPSFLDKIATTYGSIASSLKGVRAPSDAQSLNDDLVAGATKVSAALSSLATELKGASRAEKIRLLSQFDATHIPGMQEFTEAAGGLSAKGYRLRRSAGT